jgi:hypothetical protein
MLNRFKNKYNLFEINASRLEIDKSLSVKKSSSDAACREFQIITA